MDWDERAEAAHRAESLSWARKFNEARGPSLTAWVSTFRNNLPCEVVRDDCGSFNWSCKIKFKDDVQWMVRLAVPGRVMKGDEKIAHEVATMQFVKKETNIPIPSIIAWGLNEQNPLGLGPFIIMEFIEGVPLDTILRENPPPRGTSALRAYIGDTQLRILYRQVANILLELSRHDFPKIGSLSNPSDTSDPITSPPLTLKMNEVESHGGVDTGDQAPKGFLSVADYFQAVAQQDADHLYRQPNSIDDDEDARRKYQRSHHFKAIAPDFVDPRYNYGPFKLLCDDFRFGNILVNNAQDLKIVAVLDWEWAYAAPFQMLYSPPRWLLIKKPLDWDNQDFYRYNVLLNLFIEVLAEEEGKTPDTCSTPSMASLMRESMDDGRFWFHELIYSCFEFPDNWAWSAIGQSRPSMSGLASIPTSEMEHFVKTKLEQLEQYNEEWAAMKRELDRKEAEFQALRERVEREDIQGNLE